MRPFNSFRALIALSAALLFGVAEVEAETELRQRNIPMDRSSLAPATTGESITIPYFEVDLNDPKGKTLLLAVHHTGRPNSDAEVTINYIGTGPGSTGGTETQTIAPQEVFTRNLRDVENLLPAAESDGFSRGFVSIEAVGARDPIIGVQVTVDYFSVTPDEDFAVGARAAPFHSMVAGPLAPFLCDLWSVRFLSGGLFSGGTDLVLWIRQPNSPPSASLHVDVYDEAGTFRGGADITTDQDVQEIPIADILNAAGASGVSFGVLLVDFANGTQGGNVTATYEASGRFSVGLRGGCIAE